MQENVSLWLTCLAIWLDENNVWDRERGRWIFKWRQALPGKDYLNKDELERVIDEH